LWRRRGAFVEEKSLRIGVHHADAVVWGPVSADDGRWLDDFCGGVVSASRRTRLDARDEETEDGGEAQGARI
jgi:hypothetical protein